MAPLSRTPRFHDSFVVPHPRVAAIVLQPASPPTDGWVLPCWEHDARRGRTSREADDPFWPAAVQREVRRSLGLEATVLHTDLHDARDPATGDRHTAIVLEPERAGQRTWAPPPGSRWVGPSELRSTALAVPWQRGVIEAWFSETENGGDGATRAEASLRRPPWQRPAWYAAASEWITAALRRHGLARSGPAEQLGTKVGRYLLRVPTAAGYVYFKALPAMYAREPLLLRLLAGECPDRVPALLAADLGRRWLLTRDHGGVSLETATDLRAWEEALRAFAALQVVAAEAPAGPEPFLRAGCPDLRLAGLPSQFERLLSDGAVLLRGESGGVSDSEAGELRASLPGLVAAAGRLRRYGVPETLVHGDLLPGNVAAGPRGPVFLDWCEASVSHPFFSAVRFVTSALWEGRAVSAQQGVADRLRDAYLEPWARYSSANDLRDAFALAETLQPVHHALTYAHLWRLLAAETATAGAWERRAVAVRSLRRLLARRDALTSG